MVTISLLLLIAKITISRSLSCTSKTATDCNIDCNQGLTCSNQVLDCNQNGIDLNCNIACNGLGNRRRLKYGVQRNLLSIYQTNKNKGCCGSTIYCPLNKDCFIDCSQGCKDIIIHAENSSSLLIENCNINNTPHEFEVYCENMTIYCPQNIPSAHRDIGSYPNPTCIINGSDIDSTEIYTKQGFNDLELRNIQSITDTQIFCGNIAQYHCTVDFDGNACVNDSICHDLILSPNPTISPTVAIPSIGVSIGNKLTFYPTQKPTRTILDNNNNEAKIEISSTKINEYEVIFEDKKKPAALRAYGMGLEIVLLSAACFFLLMCCMLFFTLWMKKDNLKQLTGQNNEFEAKGNNNNNNHYHHSEHKIYGHMDDIVLPQTITNKPMIPSINMDNLSVLSISNFQSPSMRNIYNCSQDTIISPRTQSAIMSICTGNSEMNSEVISPWEDGLTIDDIVVAFDANTGAVGENPNKNSNVQDDEFVIDGENDEFDVETPGNYDSR